MSNIDQITSTSNLFAPDREQLFTQLTEEQGANVTGGFWKKKTYKIGNKTRGTIRYLFNASLKKVRPGKYNTHKSWLPRAFVQWDKAPGKGIKWGKKLIKSGTYVFKLIKGMRELVRV